jgi:PAS domain S-box-containing protein
MTYFSPTLCELKDSEVFQSPYFESQHNPFGAISFNLLVIVGSDGYFRKITPSFFNLLGFSLEELLAKPFWDFAHPQDRIFLQQKWPRLTEREEIINFTNGICCKDGSYRSLQWRAKSAPEKGVVYATAQDITESQNPLEFLTQVDRQLQIIMNAATQVSIIATNAEGLIKIFNPGAERMLGYKAEELVDKETPALFHLESEVVAHGVQLSEKFGRSIQDFDIFVEYARMGKYEEREWTYVKKDGTHITVNLVVTAIRTPEGEITGFLGIASDISQRKQTEVALVERNNLLTLDADIGKTLNQDQPLQIRLQFCTEAIVQHLDVAFARIWTLNTKDQVLELQASAGLYTHLEGPHGRVPVGKFKIGKIASEKKAHLTNQVIGDPRVPEQAWAKREGLVAFAGYPLMKGNDVLGVMAMFSRHSLSQFTLKILAMVASHITEGIERENRSNSFRKLAKQTELFLNSAGEGIYGLDLEGKTTFVNPAGAKMLGYEVEELLGVPMHSTMHHTKPDGTPYPRETCPMYAAFKDGTVHQVDNEVLWRKDGTSFDVEYTSTPIWEDGQLAGAVVTFKDITERRRVEKNFQLVVESAPCGMMMVDAKGLIILVNTQTEHLFGYSRDELVGQPIEVLIPERFRKNHPQHRGHFNACPSSRVMGAGRDLYGLRKDGIEIPIEIGLNPIETEKGFIVLSTILDITERKLAADKEEATRKLLQAIGGVQSQFIANIQASNVFDNVLANFLDLSQSEYGFVGEVLQTIEGNPYLKTHAITNIAWNEETRTLYEQHAPNLEFHNLNTLFGYVLSSGKSVISNDPVNDSRGGGLPKGHPPLNAFLGLPLYLDNQMVGMVGMANRPGGYEESVIEYLEPFLTVSATLIDAYRNMNLRREAEEALLKKTNALARSNKELEDFASIASHDLQEPLRKIQAFGDRLKGKWAEVLGPQGLDYLERMQHAAGRMQTLITDLLSFSRVTTKANPFVQVDLAKVANEVVSDLEIRITQVGGKVEIDDLPIIEADPTQMRQLFQNLIGNAMKFHKKDEPPLVHIQSQYVNGDHTSDSQDRWIRLTVSDNGIGFDEKYVEKIFSIFQRLHSHSEYEGTGVGLAICQKIAARHYGRITAESTFGKGTNFIITLPTVQGKDNKLI